jgi:adiponectin receptor
MDEGDADNAAVAASLQAAPKRRKGKAQAAKVQKQRKSILYGWDDLPEYLRDNEFIHTGYRSETGLRGSLRSLFTLHNESGNVWTHLVGTALLRNDCPHARTLNACDQSSTQIIKSLLHRLVAAARTHCLDSAHSGSTSVCASHSHAPHVQRSSHGDRGSTSCEESKLGVSK